MGWGTGEVPMFARIDAPQLLFLAAASILIVGIATCSDMSPVWRACLEAVFAISSIVLGTVALHLLVPH